MPTPIDLIIDLEEPRAHEQVVRYKSRERLEELVLVVNIVSCYWSRHLGLLKDSLRTGFSCVKRHAFWLPTENRNCQRNRQLDINVVHALSWNNVGLTTSSILDEASDTFESLRTIKQSLRQASMSGKLNVILRDDDMEPLLRVLDLDQLQYL